MTPDASVPVKRPGVIYLPTLPPYMDATKIRHILEKYSSIGRIYLTPEDATKYANRVKAGGCKKESYTEGWIEFHDKSEAKKMATLLNAQPIGGKKRHNFYHDDIWCMKYLPKFTWNDLMEHRVYQKQVSQKRLQTMMAKQKKEDEFLLEATAKKKEMDSAELRRKAEGTHDESRKRKAEKSLPRQKLVFGSMKPKTPSHAPSADLLDALAM